MTNPIRKLFDFFRVGLREIGVILLMMFLSLFRFSDKSRFFLVLLILEGGKVPSENTSTFLYVALKSCHLTPEIITDFERRLKFAPERKQLDAEAEREHSKSDDQRPDRKLGHELPARPDGETLH